MGWGDEIMASGEARVINLRTGRRVQILDRQGKVRWHSAWIDNPRIATQGEIGGFERIVNGGNARPYHIDAQCTKERWVYNPLFRAQRGELYLTDVEAEFGNRHANRIIIEPSIKLAASPNKQWGWARWAELVRIAAQAKIHFTQIGPGNGRRLQGVDYVVTENFRLAASVVGHATAAVLPEGGLHHVAAAFSVPAVVIFGGFTPVELTGYEGHINLGARFEDACGMRGKCVHCVEAMAKIQPARVLRDLVRLLNKRKGEGQWRM